MRGGSEMESDTQRIGRPRSSRLGVLAALLTWSCSTSGASADRAADGMFHWTITTAVDIEAPPARVWEVLVDLPAYREWNPFIIEASGTVAAGERLALRMTLPGRAPMSFAPRLL